MTEQARDGLVQAVDANADPVKGIGARGARAQASSTRLDRVEASDPGLDVGVVESHPSVIVILLDDMSPRWLDFMGIGDRFATGGLAFTDEEFRYAKTPFMTSIARETGVWFSNCFATPICSSSRARLHFGKKSSALGVGTNIRPPGGSPDSATYPSTGIAINASNTSIAEHMKANGYQTAHFGKWHIADVWSTIGNGGPLHTPDVNLTDPSVLGFDTSVWSPMPYGGVYEWWKIDNGTPTYVDGVSTTTYTEATYPSCVMSNAAIAWLESRTQRFFLSVSIDPPHMPLTSPPFTWSHGNLISAETQAELTSLGYLPGDNLSGSPQNQTARSNPEFYAAYRANIEVSDSICEDVWDSVPATLKPNTYLIILSDNGGAASTTPNGFPSNAKGSLTRGGTQVHMVVRGPGVAHPGRQIKQLVDIADVSSTIARLANYETQAFKPSTSFVPALFDTVDPENVQAFKDNSVEQIFFPLGVTNPSNFEPTSRQRSITDGSFRLILFSDGTDPQFYDERIDPLEAEDIYGGLNPEQQVAYDNLHAKLLADLPV